MADPANRVPMIVLAYLGPLALVPLLVAREDPDVQWHAKHGLVLMGAELLLLLVYLLVLSFLSVATLGVGCALSVFVTPLLVVAVIAVHVAAIIKADRGHRLIIPGVSHYTSRF